MIVLSKRLENAAHDEPKPPLNAYFKTRQAKLNQYAKEGITRKVVNRFKAFWANMPKGEKQDLENQYQRTLGKYHKDHEKWVAKHGLSDDEIKEIKASREQNRKTVGKSRSRSKSKRSKSKMSMTKKNRSNSRSKDGRKRRAFGSRSKSNDKKGKKKEGSRSKSRSKSKGRNRSKSNEKSKGKGKQTRTGRSKSQSKSKNKNRKTSRSKSQRRK